MEVKIDNLVMKGVGEMGWFRLARYKVRCDFVAFVMVMINPCFLRLMSQVGEVKYGISSFLHYITF